MTLQSKLFRGDQKLEAAAVSDPAHIVQGARGPHVAKIQQALIQLDGAAITPDGAYGRGTAAAVSAFKSKRKILNFAGKIDDIVGKKTMAALDIEMLTKERGGSSGLLGFSLPAGLLGQLVNVIPPTHTLIYFSGLSKERNSIGPGLPLAFGNREDFQIAMEGIDVRPTAKIVFGFAGSLTTLRGVASARVLINERDPRGKLIIYGFSAGGINSLQLCRELFQGGVQVDLLVTVDVSDGEKNLGVNGGVPENVVLNRNYFQKGALRGPSGIRTTGRNVRNSDVSDRPFEDITIKNHHGQMETITQIDTIRDMRLALR